MGLSASAVKKIVLGLIGGSPIMGAVKSKVEGSPLMKQLGGGGGLGGISGGLSGVLSSVPGLENLKSMTNLSSIIQNPVGDIVNQVQGALSGNLASLSGLNIPNIDNLKDTMMSSIQSVTDFKSLTERLTGISSLGDGIGLSDIVDLIKDNPNFSLSDFTGPLSSGNILEDLQGRIDNIVSQVTSGVLSASAASTMIENETRAVTDIMDQVQNKYNEALSTQGASMSMETVASAMDPDSDMPAEVRDFMSGLLDPTMRDNIATAIADAKASIPEEST